MANQIYIKIFKCFIKLCQGLQECKFIENGLRHGCFSVNFVKSFRKAFFTEQMRTAVSIILKNENKDKFNSYM